MLDFFIVRNTHTKKKQLKNFYIPPKNGLEIIFLPLHQDRSFSFPPPGNSLPEEFGQTGPLKPWGGGVGDHFGRPRIPSNHLQLAKKIFTCKTKLRTNAVGQGPGTKPPGGGMTTLPEEGGGVGLGKGAAGHPYPPRKGLPTGKIGLFGKMSQPL